MATRLYLPGARLLNQRRQNVFYSTNRGNATNVKYENAKSDKRELPCLVVRNPCSAYSKLLYLGAKLVIQRARRDWLSEA